jgi:hypothetical protein
MTTRAHADGGEIGHRDTRDCRLRALLPRHSRL